MYFYLMFKHFNAPFRVILQYPQSKGETLLQKKNFFVFQVGWKYILRGSLFIKVVLK